VVHRIGSKRPRARDAAFIAWNAEVAGDVTLGPGSSVWFSATLRGDLAPITVGESTNVQDGATLHVEGEAPLTVGSRVTVGHNAVLHGCAIGDDCLIGMGAVVLSRARIGNGSVVGAGALVPEGREYPARSLIVGNPARSLRTLDDESVEKIRGNARTYEELARQAARDYAEDPREP
jgi:carbonic anhydrase/acetyltransferase-like protein (isoleucine patch superfamily)